MSVDTEKIAQSTQGITVFQMCPELAEPFVEDRITKGLEDRRSKESVYKQERRNDLWKQIHNMACARARKLINEYDELAGSLVCEEQLNCYLQGLEDGFLLEGSVGNGREIFNGKANLRDIKPTELF